MNQSSIRSIPASRVIIALTLSLVLSAGIALATGSRGTQIFEAFSAAKRYGLPIIYLIFFLVVFVPHGKAYPRTRMPVWWIYLLVLFAVSTFFSIVVPRQHIGFVDLAQGAALICGLLLVSWAGLLTSQWSEKEQYCLLYILGTAGLITIVFNGATSMIAMVVDISLGPFVTVPIPAAFGLLYAGIRLPRGRIPLLFLGGATLAAILFSLQDDVNVSMSVLTQLVTCSLVFTALLLPRIIRHAFVASALIAMLAAFLLSSLPGLMLGRIPEDLTDVTLLHRGYEAAGVFELVGGDMASVLLGLGPSATVDLTGSPDAETLASSGRSLATVDDVHFLGSWVLMKLGVLGILWLVLIYAAIIKELAHLLGQERPAVFDSFLIMFVIAGVVSGIPAATNFFANPLAALFLGILIARRRAWGDYMSGNMRRPVVSAPDSTPV